MRSSFKSFAFSFPIQLLVLHLRNHFFFVVTWLFLAGLMAGVIGKSFGVKYLFITPEYLGEVGFLSFFFLGFTFAGFFMTWNLTIYLLSARRFPFLACLSRPFTKFCLNNSLLPLAFFVLYLWLSLRFQAQAEGWSGEILFANLLGFLIGMIALLMLVSVFFHFTNKDIRSYVKNHLADPPDLAYTLAPGGYRQRRDTQLAIQLDREKWRVTSYLNEQFQPRRVRSVAHYDSSVLLHVFHQNHLNALAFQLFSLLLMLTLGYFMDNPYCRIPAGASILILMSMVVSIAGAIAYWFQRWKVVIWLLLILSVNTLTSHNWFNHKNCAYGLDYSTSRPAYHPAVLDSLCSKKLVDADKAAMLSILESWRKKNLHHNPKMVIVCVSGGGLKSSLWTFRVLQQADSLTGGKLMNHTTLMCGASGGMIGAGYYRELFLQKQLGQIKALHDPVFSKNISKDLLNSVGFAIVSNDVFLPWIPFEKGGHRYKKDRGYIFEKQLHENTGGILEKTLADYREPERQAQIPLMFLTPSIVNDGRRLVISPHGVSYMMVAPLGLRQQKAVEVDAVDFGRLMQEQGAQNLQFSSALRMNASYPFILPDVFLPADPPVELMDAGFRDNMGLLSATRFLHVFRDWVNDNTSGVVIVQISVWDKWKEQPINRSPGLVESLFNPLGILGEITSLQEFERDYNLALLADLLGRDNFEILRFTYIPTEQNREASMSFHLTGHEKKDIMQSIFLKDNQQNLARLKRMMNDE